MILKNRKQSVHALRMIVEAAALYEQRRTAKAKEKQLNIVIDNALLLADTLRQARKT